MRRVLQDTAILGKVALGLVLLVTLFDLFTQGSVFQLISLDTTVVSSARELWRLFTFPFAIESFSSAFLFVAVFLFILPQLQNLIPKQIIVPLSFILVLFQGIILTLVFWEVPFEYRGMDGISLFFLTLTALLLPRSRIFILGRSIGNNINLSAFIFVVWVAAKMIGFEMSETRHDDIIETMSSIIFGLGFSSIMYFNLRAMKYYIRKRRQDPIDIPKMSPSKLQKVYADNLSPTVATVSERISHIEEAEESLMSQISSEKSFTSSDEELMNTLLEKIHHDGEKSLSEDEKQTLLMLSKKIDE